jgi:polar amino acid transport system substrate-binding protein
MTVRRTSVRSRSLTGAALAMTVAALVTACGSGGGGGGDAAAGSSSSAAAGPAVKADPKLTAMLPQEIQDKKSMSIGTEALYPPYEYLDKDGSTIIGLDPDLVDAVSARLGVDFTLTNTAFDGLLPALSGNRFDVVAAAVTDTKARQQNYDFVDYFKAGQAIVVAAGNPEKITGVTDLCGKPVSVLVSSAQEALLNKFNTAECASNPIKVTSLPTDQDALIQVQSGRAMATFTQEPVGRYNAAQIAGGKAFEVANKETLFANPLGFVFDKADTQLRDAWQAAVQSLIDDGTYSSILKAHELTSGAVDKATTNAGTQ